jgi:hypothetical protein
MTWTRQTPVEPGWWWFKGPGGTWIRRIAMVCYYASVDPRPFDFETNEWVDNIDGEWSGPIIPPPVPEEGI